MEMHEPRAGKNLRVTNKTGELVTLRYIPEKEAMLILVMYLTPDGNDKD